MGRLCTRQTQQVVEWIFHKYDEAQVYISARSNALEQGLMQKKPQIMQEIQSSGCYMGVEAREGVGWDGQPCTEGAQQVSANQGT